MQNEKPQSILTLLGCICIKLKTWFFQQQTRTPIILLIYYQRATLMNFLNFLTQGTSVLNFKLSNIVSGFGMNTSNVELTTPKRICPEQIIKQPASSEKCVPQQVSNIQKEQVGKKQSQVQLFTQQQQLINQYMHLNIQLLSKKLQNLEHIEKAPKQEEQAEHVEVKSNKKKIKKVNSCGHQDKDHYAKGMCSNCYHKYGRTKKPWNCPHEKLYANGMCQNCYINTYNRKRREERVEDKIDEIQGQSQLKVEQNLDE